MLQDSTAQHTQHIYQQAAMVLLRTMPRIRSVDVWQMLTYIEPATDMDEETATKLGLDYESMSKVSGWAVYCHDFLWFAITSRCSQCPPLVSRPLNHTLRDTNPRCLRHPLPTTRLSLLPNHHPKAKSHVALRSVTSCDEAEVVNEKTISLVEGRLPWPKHAVDELNRKWQSSFSPPPPRVAGRPGEPWEPSYKKAFQISTGQWVIPFHDAGLRDNLKGRR